jgi:uncharacterized protein YfaA (DUF2138 family)
MRKVAPILHARAGGAALAEPALLDGVHAPVAVCWYASGGLYSPLFVARVDSRATTDAMLGAVFGASIGNDIGAAATAGAVDVTALEGKPDKGKSGAVRTWHRTVATDFGRFEVTMARQGDWLAFSPRAQLVDDALAVFGNRRPALADSLPQGRSMIELVTAPRTLSTLLEQATLGSLPQRSEPLLREAAQNQLTPRLKALQAFAPVALMLPQPLQDRERAWQPIEWQTLNDAQ